MAKKSKRITVGLVSADSKLRTYYTTKNPDNTPDRLTIKKYDPALRKHVIFTETKKDLGKNVVKPRK